MARDARIELDFGDGTYSFRLGWGELATLQEECDAGPYMILHRLHSHQWRVQDIANVIRLGLVGGGMPPGDALKKIRQYVERRPPLENHPIAIAVISAGLLGAPEEPVGEQEAPTPEAA